MQALGLRFTALAGRIRLVSVRQHHSFKIPQPLRQTVRQQRNNSTVAPDSPHNKSTTTGPKIPTAAVIPPLPLWQRLGPLTWAIQGFGRAQRKRPYTTQFISTLVIYFLGDLGAQSLRDGDYEPERTAKSLAIGAGSSIPTYLW